MASVRKRTWSSKGEMKTAWVADYIDQLGKRHIKTFPRKKDADAWLLEARTQVNQGVHTPDRESITISDACELWLERCRVDKLERMTVDQYKVHVDAHIRPLLGRVKLSKLTMPMVEEFKDKLLTRLSRSTARNVMGSLKSAINDAQRRGYIPQNVAAPVKFPSAKTREAPSAAEYQLPSKDEVRALAEAADGWFQPMLIMAVSTGMRASELRGLEWTSVNFRRRAVNISQRADKWGKIGPPKSAAGHRSIPLSEWALEALRKWQRECLVFENSQFVFPDRTGKPRYHLRLLEQWRALQVKTCIVNADGKPRYVFHALRHFFASWAIEQGFSPKRLQALMGHSSIQMTFDTYGHLFPSAEDDHAKFALAGQSIFGRDTSATKGA